MPSFARLPKNIIIKQRRKTEVNSRMATYMGMDVHKKNCQAVAMDEEGTILKEEKVENSLEGFEPFFKDIEDAKVVIESC
ncbi:hypothetical protein AKJ38_04030 [candidate division MSBL1 archaeon SCGC-AAA259I14]|uniref:Transposase IS110-like N-terminal domain-containing protein n=1 Tax=candidate division MSBL1 archaeon SCGC-AAA259I14 TaxID=1698268 RepID=A0A133UPA3_9EURY|nr:hypothetical protein AKJ38_04030 [candidate division MSBL1 archaeon SCGC-AAA259I14]